LFKENVKLRINISCFSKGVNKMKSKSIWEVMILFCCGVFFCLIAISCSTSEPETEEKPDDENNLVYSTVLKSIISEEEILIILNDSTQMESYITSNSGIFYEKFPEAERVTFDNYIKANECKTKLKRIAGIEFVFSSEYKDTSCNKVNVYLSNVGYNSGKTEAFVSTGAMYAPLVGSGSLIFLVKINDEWQIKKTIMTWIS